MNAATAPAQVPQLDDSCPRCGGGFHCGAQDAHCDCFELRLSPALRERLAAQYSSCLCLACLRELSAAEAAPPSP